jgi:putative aldouronate transport system substrate-binding protein
MKLATKAGYLTVLLCLATLLSGLLMTACSNNSSSNAPVDLTLWANPSASEVGNPPSNWFFIQDVKKALNINLHVTLVPYGDPGNAKYATAAAANALPDLFGIQFSTQQSDAFLKWVGDGLIAPVDSLYPMMPQSTKTRFSDPEMQKLALINGKHYILQEKGTFATRQGLFIRKDWLDKLHLQMPKTLDDLMNVMKAFTYNDPDGNGKNDTFGFGTTTGSGQIGLGNTFEAIFGAYGLPGIWNYNTPGQISLSLHDPGYLQAVEYIKQMQQAKVIDPSWTTMSGTDFATIWKQTGKYGIVSNDFCAQLCQANYQAFDTNFPSGDWVPLSPPTGPSGQSFLGTYTDVGTRLAVSAKALSEGKGPAIARLLEWADQGTGYYEACFGQKGVNYTFDSQGNVTGNNVPVPFAGHDAAPINQLRSLFYNNSTSELESRYTRFTTKDGRTVDPIGIFQQIHSMPWQNQTSSFEIQPASNQNDINTYVDQGLIQFITSQKPLTTASWNSFLQGLNNLNVPAWEQQTNQTLKAEGWL